MLSDGSIKNKCRPVKAPEQYRENRERMVERQLVARKITSKRILSAFLKVPRHLFIPQELEDQAYEDHPIQIGYNQTISQPYIVALMLERLQLKSGDRVLEIGTGSGYQTALLAELVQEVYSIEIIEELYQSAKNRLNLLGYSNVYISHGDGQNGWVEKSPFDKIMVAAAVTGEIPRKLIEQLKEDGLIILPVGDQNQNLVLGRKKNAVIITKQLGSVRFVPLTGNRY